MIRDRDLATDDPALSEAIRATQRDPSSAAAKGQRTIKAQHAAVCELAKARGSITRVDVSKALEISETDAQMLLDRMSRSGKIDHMNGVYRPRRSK